MSWITIIWSMTASACLTLAAIYFVVWWRRRSAWADLLFTLTSMGVAAYAFGELSIMRAATPAQFATALRWLQVPTWVIVVSLVGFVRLHLRAGRPWLGWTIFALRTSALLLNFVTGQNLHYREVTALRHIPFLGETASLGVGVSNPWMLVGQSSLLLLAVFTVDAAITVWRRGDRRQALVTGGSIAFFTLTGMVQAVLVLWRIVDLPLTESFFFLGIVVAMGYEMSRETLRAAQLSDDLRESHQRLDLAAQSARLGLWTWDIARDEIWATDNGRQLFGFGKSERINFARLLDSLHPDDREPVSHAFAKSFNGNGDYESEHRVLVPGQPMRWIAARGTVEFNKAGKAVFMRGVSHDITERKRTEDALKESEARFRTVADTAPVLIWMAGTDKLCNFFNQGWLDFTGRTLEQELGNGWAEGIHPDDLAGCLKTFVTAFDARQPFTMEYRLRRHDGEYRWISDHGVPRFDSEGDFLGYIGSCVDLTERKHAEDEALRQRTELAHVSRVSVMGELSASMAHELNQPLTAILSNTQAAQRFLAADKLDRVEFDEILKDIVHDTTRARDVIRHLRALVKKGEREFVRVDVNEIIVQVVAFLHGDIVGRNVTVIQELAPELPLVLGDRTQLQQVLLNLLLNAFDAVGANRVPDRRVTVVTALASSEMVRVAVRDGGVGIPADKFEEIFQPFFTTKTEGLGMGLSVSRSIIESHGGRLSAENNPGPGATVSFSLPVVKQN
jgi:two-component system, LuxR family, sensor kinase FixL